VLETIDDILTIGFVVAGLVALIWVWINLRKMKKQDEEHEFHKGPDE